MKFVTRKGKNITGLTQMGWVGIIVLVLVGAGLYNAGYFTGTPVQTAIDSVLDVETDITVGLNDVFFKVAVKEDLGAFASEDIIVNAYSDEIGTWLGSVTASSGLATFSASSVQEGSYVWLQARQAAPSSADGYITPLAKYRVGNGDPTDTVSAYNAGTGQSVIWVSNLHDSNVIHANFTMIDGADLSVAASDNLTTGDTYFTFNVYMDDDECWYGAPDFTDRVNGDEYIGGIWFVMRFAADTYTFEQGSARHLYAWSDLTYSYIAFNFNVRLWQDSLRTGDLNTYSAQIKLADGADFDMGADTVLIDVFDMYKDTGGYSFGNFVNGGALDFAEITAYVD